MTIFGVDSAQVAVAFGVAASVTALELITSKYPQTFIFVLKSPWFYAYIVIYGLLGATALALLPFVADQVKTEGGVFANPWVKAALVGLSVKAFLHIRIVTVTTGPGQSFPIGLESFVQIFEPWMTRWIELNHFSEVDKFIAPRAEKTPDVGKGRGLAIGKIPTTFDDKEKTALIDDFNRAATSYNVISEFLKVFGVRLTETAFPK